MSKLITLNGIDDQSILNDILNDELVVIEDIQGSKIWVNWDGSEFHIKSKSISNDSINLVDLAMQNYYNPALRYFNELDTRVKALLNKKWWFGFEFFPDEQPGNIEYSRIPKNGLVLTSINKGGKYEFIIDELDEYTRLFDVDPLPIIYQGSLTETMKEAIKYFINTSEGDLEYIFGDKSFSFFFYKILNPSQDSSFLMDEDFQKNLEKLIIRSKTREISFELLNPLYKRLNESNNTDFVEIYTLILINFLNFCQSLNLSDIKLKGETRDEMYIYLISKVFNIYVSEVKEDLLNFDFVVPDFFDKEKFKINTELIKNKLTKEYIEEDDKLEYIFKVILGSFNKKRKKPIGIFTENTVKLFNKFVNEIEDYIGKYLGKMKEIELGRAGLLDFGNFFDIEYDVDGDQQVYPDVYDEFEKGVDSSKKKKGKGGKLIIEPASGKKIPTKDGFN
jgi:hypothetical protein